MTTTPDRLASGIDLEKCTRMPGCYKLADHLGGCSDDPFEGIPEDDGSEFLADLHASVQAKTDDRELTATSDDEVISLDEFQDRAAAGEWTSPRRKAAIAQRDAEQTEPTATDVAYLHGLNQRGRHVYGGTVTDRTRQTRRRRNRAAAASRRRNRNR